MNASTFIIRVNLVVLLNLHTIFGEEFMYYPNAARSDRFPHHELRTFDGLTPSKVKCAQICAQNEYCTSFFYNPSTESCMGSNGIFTDECGIYTQTGMVYYQPDVQNVPSTDCLSILTAAPGSPTGIYTVTLSTNRTISVYCDMDTNGGGWTVFQYRYDGAVDFYRTFQEYNVGFGDINTEFWLGLQNIHEMAPSGVDSEMQLIYDDGFGTTKVHHVSTFSVGPYPCFTVTLQNGDYDLTYNDGRPFSAYDFGEYKSCSSQRQSGWWHYGCTWVNPNGLYVTPGTSATSPSAWAGMISYLWKNYDSMAVSRLMFRRN